MATDIKLDDGSNGDFVTIEAAVLKSTGADFLIDCPPRRSSKGGPHRRALVHGQDDSLIVNFHGDYPGGTRISDAIINLKLEEQRGGEPALPRQAAIGSLRLIQTILSGPVPGTPFKDYQPGPVRLFICVGHTTIGDEAYWSEVQLGDAIVGTE